MTKPTKLEEAVDRVLELGAEVESAGEAKTGGEALQRSRELLHAWVDTVAGVVINAGLGRVTLIHTNGKESSVSSSELPFLLSQPAKFES